MRTVFLVGLVGALAVGGVLLYQKRVEEEAAATALSTVDDIHATAAAAIAQGSAQSPSSNSFIDDIPFIGDVLGAFA